MLEESPFSQHLQEHFETLKNTPLFHVGREKGWTLLQEAGLPSKTHGAFQYLPLREFYTQRFSPAPTPPVVLEDIQSAIYPECRNSYLVFVNGTLRLDLSATSDLPSQIVILPLSEALKSYKQFLSLRLHKGTEKNPFALANLALHAEGAFIFIPPKVELKKPIQCLHVLSTDPEKQAAVTPRIHLSLGAHAQVKWITSATHLKTPAPLWFNGVFDVALEEGAVLKHTDLICSRPHDWHFQNQHATLKKNSLFQNVSVTTGGKSVRQDFQINLLGEGSSATLEGIAMLEKESQAHVHVTMEHEAPHTHSSQLFKGILSGTSRSSFEGKILVRKEAQKTEAYQLNKHLLLNEGTIANSKPNLEIFADDVKASHGATVAQIDPNHLFYLQTRGIDESLAKQLLISGFCQEILNHIPHLSIAHEMRELLNRYTQG